MIPQPKTALTNACSVIFNNTLYTYTADAFQALRLEPGAKWEELPQGEKVTGGVCVGSNTGTPSTSAFFVVGGVSGTEGYHGLQKFTYETRQWESIQLATPVTHQRVGHAAVYLNATDSILVYAGRQDGVEGLSTQTFTIGASAPFQVDAYESVAPPLYKPILLPWSTHEAVLVGGSTDNRQVMLFNAHERRWVDSGATLAAPLPKGRSAIQAVLMTGDDGSKNLLTFDMTESPNMVKRTVLFNGPGQPVVDAAPLRRRVVRRKKRQDGENRAPEPLTLATWPAYNSTLAPMDTRTDYALAQGPDNMVVIAGGNGDSDHVLCMFNARQNSWENPDSTFSQIRILSNNESTTTTSATTSATTSSTTSSTITTSATVSATTTTPPATTETPTEVATPAVSSSSGPGVDAILGAILGGIAALALLLALAYLCIRRRRRRQAHMEAGHIRRASGFSSNEKDGIGFAKDSLAFGQGQAGVFRKHQQQGSQSSFSSMAILMGRQNGQNKSTSSGFGRKGSSDSRRDSSDSTFKAFKSTISKPIPQGTTVAVAAVPSLEPQQGTLRDNKSLSAATNTAAPRPRNLTASGAGADNNQGTRRSSGWNRYWSGGSALNLLGFGNGNNNNNRGNNNNAASGAVTSRRTTLVSEGSSQYSNPYRMTQDSATVPPLFPAKPRQQEEEPRMSFNRVNTGSPTFAVYSSKLNEGMSGRIESSQRPVSAISDMSGSAYSSGIPESVHDAWDPTAPNGNFYGAGSNSSNSSARSNGYNTGSIYSTPLAPASQKFTSSLAAPPRQQQTVRDDMSWLNLGAN
ncbi:hypothetical protein VTJ49DRAFT_6538 [Mycothermus thermophilus]|uniref:Pre-mRNA splicing factor CLF1 n=1 Tax=Humicola insolens TaxID=85995 RepID=A0ABR3V1E2_HUMIN